MTSVVRRNLLQLIMILGFAATTVGCGPGWVVVRDGGAPPPLKGAGPIGVVFDYSKLMVGGQSEQSWVQNKKAEDIAYEQSWNDLKKSFESNVVEGLAKDWPQGAAPAAPGPGVQVVVTPSALTMGKYMVVAATSTSVDAVMTFMVNGAPADQIRVKGEQPATIFTPSVHQHIPGVGTYIGRKIGQYVKTKQ